MVLDHVFFCPKLITIYSLLHLLHACVYYMPSLFIHALINFGLFNLCYVALLVANYFGIWLVNDETNDILATSCSYLAYRC